MKQLLHFLFLILIFSFFSQHFSYAQTGKITGNVVSSSGEFLPFVNILIVGTTQGAATDIDGNFVIIGVSPGTYSVKASAIGFHPVTTENVQVSIDLTTHLNFELTEESIELGEEVVVVATKSLVTKDLTSSTSIVTADQIEVLPVNEISEVLELQAGWVGGNVRGGRSGEVAYAIDGVQVTDVYDGSTVIDINANTVQELQFVSGAFNAEYGRAMSGYVNIATKEGQSEFTGVATAYLGDYISNGTDIFRGIDDVDPVNIRNFELSLSGPIFSNTLTFYLDARYIYFGGWRNAQYNYKPWNITINRGPTVPIEERYILSLEDSTKGDGEYIPMNWNEKLYGQLKLTLKPTTGVKLNLNFLIDDVDYQDYDHTYSYNPYGNLKRFRRGLTGIFSLTHALSPATFYQANFAYFSKDYKEYVYEDPNDPRWTHDALLIQEPKDSPSFRTGGTNAHQFKRETDTYSLSADFTSQVDRINLIKFGASVNKHKLYFYDVDLLQDPAAPDPQFTGNPFVKRHVPDKYDPSENLAIDEYTRNPLEISAYIQDKIELESIIINLGLRVDYFSTDGLVLNDLTDPDIYRPRRPENIALTLDQRRAIWYSDPEPSVQFSPRLGVAFPITDQGVIHFSYGHFFQLPKFELLYVNPEYKLPQGTGNLDVVGNPELKPQQTISGEIGLQQGFTSDLAMDITMYFRDIRNLAGTRADELRLFGGSASYSQYVNSDFGSVIGVILSLTKRLSNNWSASIDYTFQKARGNGSDPAATRNAIVDGKQPEIQLIKLDWDQLNTLNFTFSYTSEHLWGFSFIGQYGSGFPYTPTFSIDVSSLLTNAGLKPSTFNLDLRAYKDFIIGDLRLSLFLRVFNLLDIRNEENVYGDSGTANFTIDEFQARQLGNPEIVNSISEYYRDPTYYSEPRRVEIGASFFF